MVAYIKNSIVIAGLAVGLATLSGCTPEAVTDIGAYGAASAVADPPPDVATAAKNVAKDVQSNVKEAMDHVNNLGGAAKEGIYHGMDNLADWMRPNPPPKPPKAIAASYCYKTYQDILCYRAPMPGWEYRLVGYQGTFAKAPPPAVTQPLPVEGKSSPPASSRVASAQPVFATAPKPKKEEKKPDDSAAVPDPAHETLPSALSPQL